MVEILAAPFEQDVLAAFNKARTAAKLAAFTLFPNYHAIADAQVKLIADGKAPVNNDGFKGRADKVFATGRGGYQEAVGQKEFDADLKKGAAALAAELLNTQKAKVNDASQTEVAFAIAKKGKQYTWLVAFIAKTATVAKGKKEDVKISTAKDDELVIAEINKVRVAKKLSKVAVLDGYHAIGDAFVTEIATGSKPLNTEGFDDRADKVFAKGGTTYNEGVGLLTGAGAKAVQESAVQILKQQGKNIEEPETTHVGVVVATVGETTVWLVGFTRNEL
uniref:Uncharacterized protein n=1 Tax=Coptotermes formosanus TaxID=36987 RepID=R4UVA2_COPFO|nr:hypothetical protein [Coptotermes formosanus]